MVTMPKFRTTTFIGLHKGCATIEVSSLATCPDNGDAPASDGRPGKADLLGGPVTLHRFRQPAAHKCGCSNGLCAGVVDAANDQLFRRAGTGRALLTEAGACVAARLLAALRVALTLGAQAAGGTGIGPHRGSKVLRSRRIASPLSAAKHS
eukprot:TRINITY_DN20434_c0_g1_i1.p2 TRINITY_DN20434_c0_g1~~TRINITY_DN20434_c0_g1_i1.p2  ORF type:complete len:151 (+),score=16.95 TRINITY_DN20434_c0_g1_i1:326-778(+)